MILLKFMIYSHGIVNITQMVKHLVIQFQNVVKNIECETSCHILELNDKVITIFEMG